MPGNFFQRIADLKRGQPEFIIFLQVDPDIRPRAKPPAKTQSRVAGNAAFALHNLGQPVGRHAQFFRQLDLIDRKGLAALG